jgi:Terminase small subunit
MHLRRTASASVDRPVSLETRQRQSRAQLSRKQVKFVEQYAALGNAAEAARRAGYKLGNSIGQQGHENLKKPEIAAAIRRELAKSDVDVTPVRVQRRLHDISHAAQEVGQFGPAVRAEELLGKSIGMWIDQSLNVTANISGDHLRALLEIARKRQQEPIDLGDNDVRIRNADRKGEP